MEKKHGSADDQGNDQVDPCKGENGRMMFLNHRKEKTPAIGNTFPVGGGMRMGFRFSFYLHKMRAGPGEVAPGYADIAGILF